MRSHLKVLAVPLALGALLWTIDAAVDSFVFDHGGFLDQLVLHLSIYEVYVRFLACFVLVGALTWGAYASIGRSVFASSAALESKRSRIGLPQGTM